MRRCDEEEEDEDLVGNRRWPDVSPIRRDLGRQAERYRLLQTGAHAEAVHVSGEMPPPASSVVKEGEIGLECPACRTVILARQMEDVNLEVREQTPRGHPGLLEHPLRS